MPAPARSCEAGAAALTSHSSYLILSVSFQSIFMDWSERVWFSLPFPPVAVPGLAEALPRSRPRSEISL